MQYTPLSLYIYIININIYIYIYIIYNIYIYYIYVAYCLPPIAQFAYCRVHVAYCMLPIDGKSNSFSGPHKFSGYQKYLVWPAKFAVGARAPVTPKSLATRFFGSPKILHVASLIQVWAPQNYP